MPLNQQKILNTNLQHKNATGVWLNPFTGTQPSNWPQKLCNQDKQILKIVNNNPKRVWGPTANKKERSYKFGAQIW